MARGGAEGHVPQRARADRRREEDARSRGRTPARRRATRRTCRRRPSTPTAGPSASRTSSSRCRRTYTVPAEGVIEYRVLLHPDQLHRTEVDPGDRGAAGQPRGRAPRARLLPGHARPAAPAGAPAEPGRRWRCRRRRSRARGRSARIGRRAGCSPPTRPGTNPQVLRPGTAIRLEPGGVIELQMHYTANGKAATDRTRVGLHVLEGARAAEKSASRIS